MIFKMECLNCGAELNSAIQKFCEFCGNELNTKVQSDNKSTTQVEKVEFSRRKRCC